MNTVALVTCFSKDWPNMLGLFGGCLMGRARWQWWHYKFIQFLGKKEAIFEPNQCSGNHSTQGLLYLELEGQSGHLCEFKLITALSSKYFFNDLFDTCCFSLYQNYAFLLLFFQLPSSFMVNKKIPATNLTLRRLGSGKLWWFRFVLFYFSREMQGEEKEDRLNMF